MSIIFELHQFEGVITPIPSIIWLMDF